MKMYRFTLNIETAFGTPLVGDTLFGQCCWAIVHQFGETRLNQLLNDYTSQPFLVVSDAFPSGYLPLPILPAKYWQPSEETDRKKLKKRQWIAYQDTVQQAVSSWQKFAKSDKEIYSTADGKSQKVTTEQPHNTLNRQTGTTGEGAFAPYSMSQYWYAKGTKLDIYAVIDEQKISCEELHKVLSTIGQFGYGRDASIGLGKFALDQGVEVQYPTPEQANAYLTLANVAPQNNGFNQQNCFYQITTRFGRHGDISALSQNPFKKPIILAKAGAIFSPKQWQARNFIGNGLTDVSYAQPNAVHQGYAPVIPVAIEFDK